MLITNDDAKITFKGSVFLSKLYDIYQNLKEKDKDKMYLFKSGIFYIFLDEDAKKISEYTTLKCTKLNDTIVKCGFPSRCLDKYLQIFKNVNLDIMVVEDDNLKKFDIDYLKNTKVNKILNEIKKENINEISPMKAFEWIILIKEVIDNE